MANHLGTRWRGKIPIPAHAHPLVRKFIAEANEQQTTLTEIAERSGQSRATLSDWRYCRNPTIASFEAALNVIDLELCIRRRGAARIGRPPKNGENTL